MKLFPVEFEVHSSARYQKSLQAGHCPYIQGGMERFAFHLDYDYHCSPGYAVKGNRYRQPNLQHLVQIQT